MQLIQINKDVAIGQEVIQTVNARELHGFLGQSRAFANWIVDRIEKYGFVENVDFVCVTEKLSKTGSGGHNRKDYHVSIGMAKELAMVERNDQGKKARLYFIECEKRLQELAPVSTLPSYPDALRQLAATLERSAQQAVQIAQQTTLIETQKPAVEFVEKYVASTGLKTFRAVAKLLGAKEVDFRGFLVDRGIHYRLQGAWTHSARYGENGAGYFVTKTGMTTEGGLQYTRSYFTAKGVEWITRKWNERVPVLTKKNSKIPEHTSYNT